MTAATLTAENVRRLVMDTWCQTCHGEDRPDLQRGMCPDCREDLFARCFGCQPEGLEWSEQFGWHLRNPGYMMVSITVQRAIDLILKSIAWDGMLTYDKLNHVLRVLRVSVLRDLTTAIRSGDLPAAVAARHGLEDLCVNVPDH